MQMSNHKISIQSLRNFGSRRLIGVTIGLLALATIGHGLFVMSSETKARARGFQTKALEIESMQLLTTDIGWASGERHIMWTTDAGAKWTDITPPLMDSSAIRGVFFLDTSKGWVVTSRAESKGDVGLVLELSMTSDSGQTWSTKSLAELGDDEVNSASIDFADAEHGWVMARLSSSSNFSRGLLLTTSDGGQTWSKLPAPPAGDPAHFTSLTDGWLAGGPGRDELYVTRDGGNSWRRKSVSAPSAKYLSGQAVYSLPVFENSHEGVLQVMFTGANGSALVLYSTRDGGRSWRVKRVVPLLGDVNADTLIASSVVNAETVITALPQDKSLTVIDGGVQRRSLGLISNLPADMVVTRLDFKNSDVGWLLVSGGRCAGFKTDCAQETKLMATANGGRTTIEVTPQVVSPQKGETPELNAIIISGQRGFDKCTVASVSNMRTWWNSSPYSDSNVYIGGSNRGCSQPLLNSSWISQVRGQGWRFILTWVGPQAPGSSCTSCGKMSVVATTARAQGRSEADKATDAANALGLGPSTIIYYDMERYTTDSTGRAAAKAFVDGWVTRLNERGNDAGVYGSPGNALDDWQGAGVRPPRAVWIAKWDGRVTVFGLSPLPDGLWCCNQRIHQYRGGHNETFGGVTFNIDNNVADGPVEDR